MFAERCKHGPTAKLSQFEFYKNEWLDDIMHDCCFMLLRLLQILCMYTFVLNQRQLTGINFIFHAVHTVSRRFKGLNNFRRLAYHYAMLFVAVHKVSNWKAFSDHNTSTALGIFIGVWAVTSKSTSSSTLLHCYRPALMLAECCGCCQGGRST